MSLVPVRPKVSIEGMVAIHIINRISMMWPRYFKSDSKLTEIKTEPTECVIIFDDMSRMFDNPETMQLFRELMRKRKI